MFNDMQEVIEANEEAGRYFFSENTMRFFDSRVESELFDNQTFITSEKRGFEDYRRVYAVRVANPDGTISTVEKGFDSYEDAEEVALDYDSE